MTFGYLQTGPIYISSAQLLNAANTPITIVEAPGPNKMIVLILATYQLIFNTTAYSGGPENFLIYGNGSTFGPLADNGDQECMVSSANSVVISICSSVIAENGIPTSNVVNQPITYGGTPFNALIGGDGTAVITATYTIVPVF